MTKSLSAFGYTEREASFLRLAALSGGYFLRRHFNEFIGGQCGAVCQNFLKRSLQLGHVRAIPAIGSRIIYHAVAPSLYNSLGDPNNRNRREHQPATIRTRLMALDFAAPQRGVNWALTREEVAEVLREVGIVTSSSEKCQPFVLRTATSLAFPFVDESSRTYSQWLLFLNRHRGLLQQLPTAQVVFVGADEGRFRTAERTFRRSVFGETTAGDLDAARLQRYFASRRAFEAKQYEHFDQASLNELRENRQIFAGDRFEALYRAWSVDGSLPSGVKQSRSTTLSFYQLPHAYEWLSPI